MPENVRSRIFTLAKVMIAAAWADGEITEEEKLSLKDLLMLLPDAGLSAGIQMTAQEWELIEMYLDAPISPAETSRLIAELQEAVQDPNDLPIITQYLEKIANADGQATPDELSLIAEIENALNETETGLINRINHFLGGPLKRRNQKVAAAPNREQYFEDFIKNKVYYEVQQKLQTANKILSLSDAELRRFGLAGGLLARVVYVDDQVSPDEAAFIQGAIQNFWQLDAVTAGFLAEIALQAVDSNYDYYRMTREFVEGTSREERVRFLDVLFQVALADGQVSYAEIEEIRLIAEATTLTHQEFIEAKLKVPREQRAD